MTDASEVFPLTVTVPQSPQLAGVIEITDSLASVRAAFVERDSIYNLPPVWKNSCGFYVLFSGVSPDGSYSAYVGKSDADFTRRIKNHHQNKEDWIAALLVQRNSIDSLSSTQSSFLEGAMRDVFDLAPHVKCNNIAKTGDHTLPSHELPLMRQIVESTLRMILVRGYRVKLAPSLPPVAPSSAPAPAPRAVPVSAPQKPQRAPQTTAAPPTSAVPNPASEAVFQELRAWRLQKTREENLGAAYLVFKDAELRAISESLPATMDELLSLPGVARGRSMKYGEGALQVLARLRAHSLS